MESKKTWPVYTLLIAAVVLIAITTVMVYNSTGNGVTNDSVKAAVNDAVGKINLTVSVPASVPVQDSNATLTILNKVTESDQKEAKALELVNSELSSRDFKKFVMNYLNDQNASIEDYKDVYSVVVTKNDVTVSGNDATVNVDLKIKFFANGDSDTSDLQAAKIRGEFSVIDLKTKENLDNAEVDSYNTSDFEFVKFYPN